MPKRAPDALSPGDWIDGEYRVRRVLGGQGKSGMGVVYLAERYRSEELHVIKTYQLGAGASLAKRFAAEAEAWIRLGAHPHVAQCYWVKEIGGQLHAAAEFVPPDEKGRNTLASLMETGRIDPRQLVRWCAEFCYAMQHAHRSGIVAHRDIKPANILISGDLTLKITDFGLVKLRDAELREPNKKSRKPQDSVTNFGEVLGSLPFMAPEQFYDASSVDGRADIYAWGVILFAALTGELPFKPSSSEVSKLGPLRAWANAHMHAAMPRLKSPWHEVCSRCLEKDPEARFQKFDELLHAVRTLADKLKIALPPEKAAETLEAVLLRLRQLNDSAQSASALELVRELPADIAQMPRVLAEVGRSFLNLRQPQKAVEALEGSIAKDPTRTAVWHNLGAALVLAKRADDARAAFSRSIALEPENTGALTGLAQLLSAAGEHAKAKTLVDVALFWRPEKPLVLKAAAICAMSRKDMLNAETHLQALCRLDPDDADHEFNLAQCLGANGKHAEKVRILMNLLARRPADVEVASQLVQTFLDLGDSYEALRACERLAQIPGRQIMAACKSAQILAAQGQPLKAHKLLSLWLKIHERSAALWLAQAAVLAPLDVYRSQALTAAQNALLCARENPGELSPNDLTALRNLVRELQS